MTATDQGVHPAVAEVSYSRIESYEKCPRAFWHAYVNRTPPDGYERAEAWIGSLVHKVLEDSLRQTLDKQVPDPVAVMESFDRLYDEADKQLVHVVRADRSIDQYRDHARTWIRDYLDDQWPFVQDADPLHVEEEVSFPVELSDDRTARFRGYVDRIDRLRDGRLRLIDYKTGSWVPDFSSPRDAYQLALYWAGVLRRYPETPGGVLVWHYLQRRVSKHVDPDPGLVAQAQAWVTQSVASINSKLEAQGEGEESFQAKPGPLCRWCQFGYACEDNPYAKEAPQPRA